MPSRDNNDNQLKICGNIESVESCNGPCVSKLRGIDKQCCSTCYNMRNCFYRNSVFLSKDKFIFDYIEKLKFIQDIETCYAISNCGKEKTIAIRLLRTELSSKSYYNILYKQFLILHEMGVVINNISRYNFSCTDFGIPIVIPDGDISFRTNYDGDQGVMFLIHNGKKYITVTDEKSLIDSGKYAFLINFYKSMTILSGKDNRDFDFYLEKDNDYYEYPDSLIINFPEIIYKTEKVDVNEIVKIPGNSNDKYVILDLDNTLICSGNCDSVFVDHERVFYIKLIQRKLIYKVLIRPHLKKFLTELTDMGFKLIVWSAGKEKYVKDITSVIFKNIPLTYVFTYEHTTDDYYKKLSLIGNYIENFNIENCRLVDDNNLHKKDQEKYFISIDPFETDNINHHDDVLMNFSLEIKKKFEN